MKTVRCVLFTLPLILITALYAQEKQPLDHSVYEIWKEITQHEISRDGNWVLYTVAPDNGDPELRVTHTESGQSHTVVRGDAATFTPDSRFVVFKIRVPKDSIYAAREHDVKKEDMPQDSLGVLNLSSGDLQKFPKVQSYKVPEEQGNIVAFSLRETALPEDTSESEEASTEDKPDTSDTKPDKDKAAGTPLVVLNPASSAADTFYHALDFSITENGNYLAYAAASEDSTADGVYLVSTEHFRRTTVMNQPGDYKQLALDKAGEHLAFLSNAATFSADQPEFKLYHTPLNRIRVRTLATGNEPDIPGNWWISEHGDLSFSEESSRLFFGTAPKPEPDTTAEIPDHEKVVVDIWHYQDPYLQTMQQERLEQEDKRTYLAAVQLRNGKVVQLGNKNIPEVHVGNKGEAPVAVGTSHLPYRQLISWEYPEYNDVYLIDMQSGDHELVLTKLQYTARLSPEGRYLYWWDRNELKWYVKDVRRGAPVQVSAGVPHTLHNEDHDWPFAPSPYGAAGWTVDDAQFLIYDRHDIWSLDPEGDDAPVNITDGYGRSNNLRLRYVDLDRDEESIQPDESLLLSAFHYENKQSGYYRDQVNGSRTPEELIFMKRRFAGVKQAKDAETLLYTRESFQEFPDLWVATPDFSSPEQLSSLNPQQSEYLWGTAELYEWRSLDGEQLQGILYKPENFHPDSTYPMLTYFYEKNSDNIHRHWAPEAHRSIINLTFYASRGYVIFVPDIPYQIGYPGESALDAVLPGVSQLMAEPWVDEENLGVQGHSWGGYQIAYLVTQTDMFKCAEAGAPVSNMVSAYGGIRWGSGMSRMFQYEQTQSRIGGSLWEYPLRYVENSPIFFADKINTPLLILHNDHDGAVPWYQGIELFVALRRLNKPAWMINYNNEPHWPVKYQNRVDWAKRMQTYFDHYLKGAPAPVWLDEGIPAIEKGETLGFEVTGE